MYWAIITFPLLYEQCIAADSTDLGAWLNELSEQNLVNLVNVSDKDYNGTLSKRYQYIDPKALRQTQDLTMKNQQIVKDTQKLNPGLDFVDKACYTIQTTWRRVLRDMHRYITLREHYENTHYFEIGYLTHVIVSKYMNIIELYDIVNYRFIQNPTKNYGPTVWVWYMYTNILVYSRDIIHFCNMMHEIKKKFGVESGTSKDGPDYESLATPDPQDMEIEKYVKNIQQDYQAGLAARKKKQLQARLRYKYGMRKPSMNLTTTRTKRPPQFWKWRTGTAGRGKDYGWSVEEFAANY